VIHGDAPGGADALAGAVAARLGFRVEPMARSREDYARYRRAARKGLNKRMLASEVVLVLAFHADLARSWGTRHLVELARAAGIEARVFGA
jgi:hypothetical protein